jgi:hypothetical protein
MYWNFVAIDGVVKNQSSQKFPPFAKYDLA